MEKTKNDPVNCSFFGKNFKKKRMNKDKYLAKYNAVFDQLDLVRIFIFLILYRDVPN